VSKLRRRPGNNLDPELRRVVGALIGHHAGLLVDVYVARGSGRCDLALRSFCRLFYSKNPRSRLSFSSTRPTLVLAVPLLRFLYCLVLVFLLSALFHLLRAFFCFLCSSCFPCLPALPLLSLSCFYLCFVSPNSSMFCFLSVGLCVFLCLFCLCCFCLVGFNSHLSLPRSVVLHH